MKEYVAGKKYDGLVRGADGVRIDFSGNKGMILVQYGSPREKEISNISTGRFQIHERVLGGIMFFAFRFGALSWMDAPYTPHLSKHPVSEGRGGAGSEIELDIILADRRDGRIVAIRRITLGSRFSGKVFKDSETLLQEPFSFEGYGRDIEGVYAKYSTSDIVKLSNGNRFQTSEAEILEASELNLFTADAVADNFDPDSLERWQLEMAKLYDTVSRMVKAGASPEHALRAFTEANGLKTKRAYPDKWIIYENGSERALEVIPGKRGMRISIVSNPAYAFMEMFDFIYSA